MALPSAVVASRKALFDSNLAANYLAVIRLATDPDYGRLMSSRQSTPNKPSVEDLASVFEIEF